MPSAHSSKADSQGAKWPCRHPFIVSIFHGLSFREFRIGVCCRTVSHMHRRFLAGETARFLAYQNHLASSQDNLQLLRVFSCMIRASGLWTIRQNSALSARRSAATPSALKTPLAERSGRSLWGKAVLLPSLSPVKENICCQQCWTTGQKSGTTTCSLLTYHQHNTTHTTTIPSSHPHNCLLLNSPLFSSPAA